MGIAFVALGCTLGASSFAWFLLPSSTKQVNGMDGEATGSYFSPVNEDGKADGTKEHPYGIKNAKQLYYFNWLQDLGYFNRDEKNASGEKASDGTIDQQYYFVLMNDIDANNYVLPPAGTKDYPFVGNFDGGGHTISNLKISNSWNDLTDIPKGATQNGTMLSNAEIVGFFGIIGQYSSGASTTTDSVTTGSVNCKGSDGNATTATYTIRSVSGTGDEATTTYVNAVNDLYFDNLNVSTVADKTLAGLLAGYVNGQMQYCGVRSGYFSFGTNVGVLTDNVLGAANTKLSKYSIVGDCNSNNFSWAGKPKDGGDGTDNDWGGSIDIASLAKRLDFIARTEGVSTTTSYPTYTSTDYNASLYYTNKYFTWDTPKNYGQNVGLNDSTYLPLNIDLAEATISGAYTGEMGSYYSSHTSEPILESTNTGYIVGRNTSGNATPKVHNKTFAYMSTYSSSSNGPIYSFYATDASGRSINASKTNDHGVYDIFDYKNLSFFYCDSETGATYRIKDEENSTTAWSTTLTTNSIDVSACGFGDLNLGYYKVKHNFAQMMTDENTDTILGGSVIQTNAIQFYRLSSETLESGIYSNVVINGHTYDKYAMYKGGINFELSSAGSLKLVLGTYTAGDVDHIMPSLYKVTRSEDAYSSISNKKITEIYRAGNSTTGFTYYSQFSDNSAVIPNDATKILDIKALNENKYLKKRCAYYVEIPLEAGDYFIGSDNKLNYNAYVMYLDIGANASGKGDTSKADEIPPIDFVYYSNASSKTIKPINSTKEITGEDGQTTTVSDYTPSKVTFAISGSPTTVYFYRVRSVSSDGTETITVYWANSAGTNATVAKTGTGTTAEGSSADYGKSEDTTSGGAN